MFLLKSRAKAFKLPENINTIVLGNSTIEDGINDRVMGNSYNLGLGFEVMDHVYVKLKLLKKFNPQIDTVLIGFDDIILFKKEFNSPRIPNPSFLDQYDMQDRWMNFKEFSSTRRTESVLNLYNFFAVKNLIKTNFKNPTLSDLDIGGYAATNRHNLERSIKKRKESPNAPKLIEDFPPINKYYLNRIIELSKTENIKLFFVTTPKHKITWSDSTYRDIHRKYFPDVAHIDCMQMSLPDSCFSDCTHLNYIGATCFGIKLREILRQN